MKTDPASERIERERTFHDQWAAAEAMPMDPTHCNTARTSPELRFIHERLGEVRGKSVLDLGCGLGEASVYFALRGADVTASDLSPEMLKATERLAQSKGTRLRTHLSAAEDLGLPAGQRFDIIYVGNLFHHVDLPATLDRLLPHLTEDGVLASWDPLAYNPLINAYRAIATEVRTPDEHPLKKADVREITHRFKQIELRFFWLTSLVVFLLMAFAQFKNPNRTRYWKAVVEDSAKWAWIYNPAEAVDTFLLKCFPALGWLCWNVVILARQPKRGHV